MRLSTQETRGFLGFPATSPVRKEKRSASSEKSAASSRTAAAAFQCNFTASSFSRGQSFLIELSSLARARAYTRLSHTSHSAFLALEKEAPNGVTVYNHQPTSSRARQLPKIDPLYIYMYTHIYKEL